MHEKISFIPVNSGIWSMLILLFVYSTSIHAQTKMSTSEAEALKATVKELSNNTETITADFVQYKHLDFLSNDIESNGKLAFKSPNMVKWEYLKPDAYSVLFKDEMLFINDDGNKNTMDMGSNKIFTQLNQLITASIKGDMFDASEFEVFYYKTKKNSEVHFNPKDKQLSEFIKSFQITFNVEGEVKEVKMVEPTDDYTQIIFTNRTTNQVLSDKVFTQ